MSKSSLAFSEKARNIIQATLAPPVGDCASTSGESPRAVDAPPRTITPALTDFPCLQCDHVATTSDDIQAHLLQVHSIVIADSHKIADLVKYLQYWKERLCSMKVTDVAAQINAPTDGKEQLYYLISDVLPEDKKIRQKLQTDLLNEMLQLQQEERKNTGVARACLFCRLAPRGRDALFEHMRDAHGFSVGQPDNLVDIDNLLNILRTTLDGLQCIFCERIFKDYGTLRAHMKKKRHFKINGQNKLYDRFYLINFLEWGKSWEELQREPADDDDDDESDSTSSVDNTVDGWRDWVEGAPEADVIDEPTICLFCPQQLESSEMVVQHVQKDHGLDLVRLRDDWELDMYATVRLINYLRRSFNDRRCPKCGEQLNSSEAYVSHLKEKQHFGVERDAAFWKDDEFLHPVVDDDPFLRCPLVVGGDSDSDWSDDEDDLKHAREEAIQRQKDLFDTLKKAGAM